jgi:uncharacterized protein YjbJ (UPF0337 family)
MNGDILKGRWKEIKGGAKVTWGKLTDRKLTQLEGNKEKFLGLLQRNYGYARDVAGHEYRHLFGS